MSRGHGTVQRKLLLLLVGGLALGLSGSPVGFFRILRMIGREWEEIERQALRRAIRDLYASKLITTRDNADGSVTITLTQTGRKKALTYQLETMRIPTPRQWDGRWRLVIFDIPEKQKKARDALRYHLKRMGLRELQKSVFIIPYPCADEIDFLIEFFQLRRHVRQLTITSIDNELHLRKLFGLT